MSDKPRDQIRRELGFDLVEGHRLSQKNGDKTMHNSFIVKPLCDTAMLSSPEYNPARLLTNLFEILNVKNDYSLTKILQIQHCALTRIRGRHKAISSGLLLRMHDITGIPVNTLREWAGLPIYTTVALTSTKL